MNIQLAHINDRKEIMEFFQREYYNHYRNNDLLHLKDFLMEEIEGKRALLDRYFNNENCSFFVGKINNKIIATLSLQEVDDIIKDNTSATKDDIEMESIFVEESEKSKGYGSQMIKFAIEYLKSNKIDSFYLHSGYESSKLIWNKKFGQAKFTLENYWGKDLSHMIWKINL